VLDSAQALYYVNQGHGLRIAAEFGTTEGVVFGVRRGNTVLRDQMDAALLDAARNGRYARAYATWFGRPPAWAPDR
jgi:polar amino acid transport system substrate-binding protein